MRPVDLDRARADAQLMRDGLVRLAGDEPDQHLPLPRGEQRDLADRLGLGRRRQAAQRLGDGAEDGGVLIGLLDEVDRAGLHGPDRQRDVAMAADQDRRDHAAAAAQRLHQRHAIHAAGHADIDDEAAGLGRQPGQQGLGRGEADRGIARRAQQQGERVAHRAIVVDDGDEDGRRRAAGREGGGRAHAAVPAAAAAG